MTRTTLITPTKINTIVRGKGLKGEPGPNIIDSSTSTPFDGVIAGDGENAYSIPLGELVTQDDIEAERYRISGPPTEILSGEAYIVPERRQVGIAIPITIQAGGVLSMEAGGVIYEV